VDKMSEKEMIQKILEITQQTQQSVLELTADVADLKERVTNIEENMVRKSDLKYYDFIAEHDREIFQLKQQN
jgi:hypothetical protein